MKKWAEVLIETHRNPISKLNTTGDKLYVPENSQQEKELVAKNLGILSDTIKLERVERRCARIKAVWLPDKNIAKVTKTLGLQQFGFEDKTGSYLYPEETLFLLETNRLELSWNDVPFSVQQGYNVVINENSCNLSRYEAYKKLAIRGYKLERSDEIKRKEKICVPTKKKIKLDNCSLDAEVNNSGVTVIADVFAKLEENAPKKCAMTFNEDDLYKVSMPANGSKSVHRCNLHVIDSKEVPTTLGFFKEVNPNMFGVVTSDSIGYYRFSGVNLPTLNDDNN